MKLVVDLADEAATDRLGRALSKMVQAGEAICLTGPSMALESSGGKVARNRVDIDLVTRRVGVHEQRDTDRAAHGDGGDCDHPVLHSTETSDGKTRWGALARQPWLLTAARPEGTWVL